MGSKVCQRCGVEKDLSEYHKKKQIPDGKHTLCKICNREKVKQWRAENPEKARDLGYRKYGITYSEYGAWLVKVDFRCEICKRTRDEVPRASLFVDHCHNSGDNRGLLCLHCNNLLGAAMDSKEVLESAIQYLDR